jgi:hypothetical protein
MRTHSCKQHEQDEGDEIYDLWAGRSTFEHISQGGRALMELTLARVPHIADYIGK